VCAGSVLGRRINRDIHPIYITCTRIGIYRAVGTSAEIMKLLGGRGGVYVCVAQRPHVEEKQIATGPGPWGGEGGQRGWGGKRRQTKK